MVGAVENIWAFFIKKKKEQKNDAGDTFEIFNDNKNVRTFLEIDEK